MDGTTESARPTFAKRLKETLALFDLSPEKYPFDDRRVKKIIERRKQLRGELFFDYLLQQAGISKPAKLFPPTTPRQFEVLIREILSSDWGVSEIGGLSQEVNEFSQETGVSQGTPKNLQAGIKRACLIYYLLAWWDNEAHLKYSENMRLASQFTELTHAHFLFDIGFTANAASLLCTPLITAEPALVQKVFHALSISTDADPSVLILRYARMAKPELKPQEVLFSYVDALAKINFMEAWSYQRTFQDAQRVEILGVIYEAILRPRPLRTALQLLSVVPLQAFERDFLHEYALRPPQEIPEHSVSALHSLIILRLTVEGDYSTAVKINREFSQYGERLLNSASLEDSRSFSMDARSRPGILIAQKAEESREMLRESVSLLPLEHRRQLESQLSDGGISATASFANPNVSHVGMEMSWEAVTAPLGSTPMHSTPPRGSSPVRPTGGNVRSPIVIPSSPTKGPSSPQKKSPLVSKFPVPSTPIDTQTLGRVFKPPTPKRSGLMPYMTPLRTPMVANMAGKVPGSMGGVDTDRSGAPPPTTGRAGSKNAFFDPDVRAVKGLILPTGSSPLSGERGRPKSRIPADDVEMQDVDAEDDTESEEEVLGELDGQSDESFVFAAPPRSSTTGHLSASNIVALKKMQEREREAKEKERERATTREREMAAKRARLEQQRQSLGNDSSFTSVGSGAGKRKRDGEDDMGRSDEEMQEADTSAGRGKRKSDGGLMQVVRKPLPAATAATVAPLLPTSRVISVPVPAPSAASMSSRAGALVPPTTIAPSVTSAGAPPSEGATGPFRRSSRISTTSNSAGESVAGGSQAGSARAPSATPSAGNPTDDEDEQPTSPQMPGAFVLEEQDNAPPARKTRGAQTRSAKPPSKPKAVAKPTSKGESSTGKTPTRPTRSKRNVSSLASVPTPIAEDGVLETVDEDEPITQSPSKGRGKKGAAAASAKKKAVEETTEGETDDATERRRSSRRLNTALAGAEPESSSASAAAGARKSGRRA